MNKRTIQIDVIGPIEETELMKCKLYFIDFESGCEKIRKVDA